nr:hypothetical protein Iba_scaffold38136CG0020 [Ipomoea batatas]GMD56692.1 hypothetical protein Iba_scaffold47997CG0020 [Ipomoea batatas]
MKQTQLLVRLKLTRDRSLRVVCCARLLMQSRKLTSFIRHQNGMELQLGITCWLSPGLQFLESLILKQLLEHKNRGQNHRKKLKMGHQLCIDLKLVL